ncbi:MAG: MAPEG family protein [Pseudomonadota bacterium]
MTWTAHTLLALVAWYILMVMLLGGYRSLLVFGGKRAANQFQASGDDMEGFGKRVTRVHANCYENLPAAAAVLLYAIATNQTAVTDPLANIFLGARIAQSVVHLISTARPAVFLRFGLFIAQLAILTWWILAFLGLRG